MAGRTDLWRGGRSCGVADGAVARRTDRLSDRPVYYTSGMSTRASDTRPTRDRLLDAASELFYQHGVHTVGIDTIIERAGVAKASLYSAYGSKEELVRAYLEARHASRRAAVLAEMEMHDDPMGKLLAVFDVLITMVKRPTFRGCAFANASAESELDSAAAEVTRKVREWMLALMAEQA